MYSPNSAHFPSAHNGILENYRHSILPENDCTVPLGASLLSLSHWPVRDRMASWFLISSYSFYSENTFVIRTFSRRTSLRIISFIIHIFVLLRTFLISILSSFLFRCSFAERIIANVIIPVMIPRGFFLLFLLLISVSTSSALRIDEDYSLKDSEDEAETTRWEKTCPCNPKFNFRTTRTEQVTPRRNCSRDIQIIDKLLNGTGYNKFRIPSTFMYTQWDRITLDQISEISERQ